MGEAAIQVEALGKQYRYRESQPRYRTLRETISGALRPPARLLSREARAASAAAPVEDLFWALQDVSFEVAPGEVVGIVGRNGAGKSTLLKILSRITEPTRGFAQIRGRMGSLLEVGTGFHPELTGRENIFLNGAILGMRRGHIERRFAEIVAFAEVEKFLDLPVKHYSTGMYLRLAFGVAAHLDPEILLIDEVLAVGDAQFQKKCLGKVEEVGRRGITVLVVTHNMAVVSQMCSRALWLSNGRLKALGKADEVVAAYLVEGADQSGHVAIDVAHTAAPFNFLSLSALNEAGVAAAAFDIRERITVSLEYVVTEPIQGLELSVRISNALGVPIFTSDRSASIDSEPGRGRFVSSFAIPPLFLAPGSYFIDLAAHVPRAKVVQHLPSILTFRVEDTGSAVTGYEGQPNGVVLLQLPWQEQRA